MDWIPALLLPLIWPVLVHPQSLKIEPNPEERYVSTRQQVHKGFQTNEWERQVNHKLSNSVLTSYLIGGVNDMLNINWRWALSAPIIQTWKGNNYMALIWGSFFLGWWNKDLKNIIITLSDQMQTYNFSEFYKLHSREGYKFGMCSSHCIKIGSDWRVGCYI